MKANDVVKHIPTGEEWVVCGVNGHNIIPCGYPFPSMARIEDCVLIEERNTPQTKEQADALIKSGLPRFVEYK